MVSLSFLFTGAVVVAVKFDIESATNILFVDIHVRNEFFSRILLLLIFLSGDLIDLDTVTLSVKILKHVRKTIGT